MNDNWDKWELQYSVYGEWRTITQIATDKEGNKFHPSSSSLEDALKSMAHFHSVNEYKLHFRLRNTLTHEIIPGDIL